MRTREAIPVIKYNLSHWISDIKAGHGFLIIKKPRGGLIYGHIDLSRCKVVTRDTREEVVK